MKVKNLKRIIADIDDEVVVVALEDAEQNLFRPIGGVSTQLLFDSKNEKLGIFALTKETEEAGYELSDILKDGMPCVAIWPHD